MTKRAVAALVVSFVLAMGIALSGCSDAKADFIGTWSLESGSSSALDASAVKLLKSAGYDITLVLNENGLGTIDLTDRKYNVTWEAKSATDGTINIEGGVSGSLSLTEGQLVIGSDDGSTMTFTKIDGESEKQS